MLGTALALSPGNTAALIKGGGAPSVMPLAFPAFGAAYDFDWTWELDSVAPYRVIPPHTGAQPLNYNEVPILYKQMLTQVQHWIENEDGSLRSVSNTLGPRRTNRGLHSFNGEDQATNFPRDLTNAAWVKSGATASQNQVGRNGSANSASLITFNSDDDRITQVYSFGSSSRRLDLDLRRVSGTDPLQYSFDDVTYYDADSDGRPFGDWWHHSSQSFTLAAPTLYLRSKAGNAFVIDFVCLWRDRDSLTQPPFYGQRLSSKTLTQRDRIHHTITQTGGTTGEEGINLVRSMDSHGMFSEFSYQTSNALVSTIGGIEVITNASIQQVTVRQQSNGAGIAVPAPIDSTGGRASPMNKLMYYREPGLLRVAINGVLSTAEIAGVSGETTTHDFATNGAGRALNGLVKRLIWFDDSRRPSDDEMIAWTA